MVLDLVTGLLYRLAGSTRPCCLPSLAHSPALETSALVGAVGPRRRRDPAGRHHRHLPPPVRAQVGAVVAGSLVGESVGYLLGRRFGDRLRSSRLGRRLGEQHWAKAEGFLNGRGGRAVFAPASSP